MERQELHERLESAAKTIYAYSLARTKNSHDAQDLAQDILLEIYVSAVNLRDDRAFYGFMWTIAGNVYKRWCKKAYTRNEAIGNEMILCHEDDEDAEQVGLVRRELALLSRKYREAAILYYVKNQSCEDISDTLSIGVSMVKYLLFKTRQIVKEGMNMERHYGEQSYHPRALELQFWGRGSNEYVDLCKSRIAQNILFACYQDKLSAEQISLEIGVMLPYMEEELEKLCSCGLIRREGKKYSTNVVVFTAELEQEISSKTQWCVKRIAQMIEQFIIANEPQIRKIGFYGADMEQSTLKWQIAAGILYQAAVVRALNESMAKQPGPKCLVWAIERTAEAPYSVGISNGVDARGNYIQFVDFGIHGEMVHRYCREHRAAISILLGIADQNVKSFSENDWAEVAEMTRRGYISSRDGHVNMPVFSQNQYEQLLKMIEAPVDEIGKELKKIKEIADQILMNHVPLHLRRNLPGLSDLRLLQDGISAVVEYLVQTQFLVARSNGGMLPTTYIVLNNR